MNELTRTLVAVSAGQSASSDDLLPLVYQELRWLAAAMMAKEPLGQTLQPTALVHEAWLRLVGKDGPAQFNSRGHFFGAAAEAMRRILIENARRKQAKRHGGGLQRLDIQDVDVAVAGEEDELLAINDALEKFSTQNQSKAELVKMRYFAGLTLEEAAEILGISVPTAKRWWTYSRAWLFNEIKSQPQ